MTRSAGPPDEETTEPTTQKRRLFPPPSRSAQKSEDSGVPLTPDRAREVLETCDHEAFFKSVAGLARPGHGSVLQTMSYSPEVDFHRADCVVVEPDPANIDTMLLYSKAAWPTFEADLLNPMLDSRYDELRAEVYYRLVEESGNLALVTNHGEIIDIAVVLSAFAIATVMRADHYGVLGESTSIDELAPHLNLLVSRMVATTAAFGLPTMNVLQTMCRTYLSVPQTISRRKARIDPTLARASNVLARSELANQLDQGGQLLAMAASGSQDLRLAAGLMQRVRTNWRSLRHEDPGEEPSLHLQPLYDGTINLMLACRYVVPVAISLNRAHPACVLGAITRVKTPDDCHDIMRWIASTHETATGVATVYHSHEDPLLDQVRSVIRQRSS